jgi:cbb3-type cytochrome oxidase subunit 1
MVEAVLLIIVWTVASATLVPMVASRKNERVFPWVMAALFLSPLLTLIALAAIPVSEPERPLRPL